MAMDNQVFIGLGANLGDPEVNIRTALTNFTQLGTNLIISSLYESKPLVAEGQNPALAPPFLNAVASFTTTLTPQALHSALLFIEQQIGRVRKNRWESRVIDLDILTYGEHCITEEKLVIPHPEIAHRDFVLVPLLELMPTWVHPKTKEPGVVLLDRLSHEDRFIMRITKNADDMKTEMIEKLL